jgi:hypothetical protein
MRTRNSKWAVKAVGAGALALVLTSPLFAQSRSDQRQGSERDRGRTESTRRDDRSGNRSYRENERVSVQGRVTSLSRERDGYRMQLDSGRESYWVPQSYARSRGNDLRVGVSIVLGGVFRRGAVYVDAVSWPDRGGYADQENLRGTVERVDYRSGTVWVREDRSGRTVAVDLRSAASRSSRLGLDDIRRGDEIELTGRWSRGGGFDADRIDGIRNGRY